MNIFKLYWAKIPVEPPNQKDFERHLKVTINFERLKNWHTNDNYWVAQTVDNKRVQNLFFFLKKDRKRYKKIFNPPITQKFKIGVQISVGPSIYIPKQLFNNNNTSKLFAFYIYIQCSLSPKEISWTKKLFELSVVISKTQWNARNI